MSSLATLEDELSRMAAERDEVCKVLARQQADATRLQLQKEQLVAFLVHDLKNPVNAIELLGQRIDRDPQASTRSRDVATRIHVEVQALLLMITTLLDLSKADEGRLVPVKQRLSIGGLLATIASEMRPRAHAVRVEIEVEVETTLLDVSADACIARRIIENLLDNALRHAPEDSVVRLTANHDHDGVEVRISDAGLGIPSELHATIFDRFVQAGVGSARIGHGLGLAFCKLAVEAHGGRIWIEDAEPGAVFCVSLPDC